MRRRDKNSLTFHVAASSLGNKLNKITPTEINLNSTIDIDNLSEFTNVVQ